MKVKGIEKENILLRLFKAPYRLLIIARDAYIRSITSCSSAGILTGGGSSGFGQFSRNFQICEAPNTALPRSFTLTSTAHDQGILTRGGQLERQPMPLDRRNNYRCVAVMERIDEEVSCDDEFEEEDFVLHGGK